MYDKSPCSGADGDGSILRTRSYGKLTNHDSNVISLKRVDGKTSNRK
ncbi:hypothetical protein [Candidatus Nitrosocosmicus sp. T]